MQTELAAGPAAAAGARPRPLNLVKQWRDRLLASPRFQNWAAAFPLTRRIARRDARALFDICAGFVYAQVLRVCVELDLFEQLAAGPLGVSLLARRASLSDDAMRLVLNARGVAAAAGNRGGMKASALAGSARRCAATPASWRWVQHHRLFLRRSRRSAGVAARQGRHQAWAVLALSRRPRRRRRLLRADGEVAALHHPGDFSAATTSPGTARCSISAAATAASLPPSPPRRRSCACNCSTCRGWRRGRERASPRRRAGPDAEIHEGSFFGTPFPEGADLITLIRVLHDHDDAAALTILRSAHRALPRGGTLLIAEPMAGSRHAEPVGRRLFQFLPAGHRWRPATPRRRSAGAAAPRRFYRRAGNSDAAADPDKPHHRAKTVNYT